MRKKLILFSLLILIILIIIYIYKLNTLEIGQVTVQNKVHPDFNITEEDKIEDLSIYISKIEWDTNRKVEMAYQEDITLLIGDKNPTIFRIWTGNSEKLEIIKNDGMYGQLKGKYAVKMKKLLLDE